jgi:histidinol-phosphate phosphatase family protein
MTATVRRTAVFLDKDGTLVEDVPFNVDPALLRFTPRALPALRRLADAGYLLVIVSNQPGLALGRFTPAQFDTLREALIARLRHEGGVEIAGVYACPHAPALADGTGCDCRKPMPGLLSAAAAALEVDLAASWMVGDILDDVEAGRRAGCRAVLLDRGGETQWRMSPLRTPHRVCSDLAEAAQAILEADAQPVAEAAFPGAA